MVSENMLSLFFRQTQYIRLYAAVRYAPEIKTIQPLVWLSQQVTMDALSMSMLSSTVGFSR